MSIPTQKAVHLSGLNGFRALAATGVVISHIITSAITEFGLPPTYLVIGGSIIVAYVSYQFFEKRFLVLKHNYSAVNSSDTAEKTPEVVVSKEVA